jgi:ferric-dicitrate binding protein FerR (iron transport regulator)
MDKLPRPTTPEEEGIELHSDAWERFERLVDQVAKAPPVHRTAKPTGADQAQKRRAAKSSR